MELQSITPKKVAPLLKAGHVQCEICGKGANPKSMSSHQNSQACMRQAYLNSN